MYGDNCFTIACSKGYYELVKLLIKYKDKINIKHINNSGFNGFMVACFYQH